MCTRREEVSFRDVKIKIPDRTWGCEWCHAPEACTEDFGRFEKSLLSWVSGLEENGCLSLARHGLVVGAHVVWGRWKSQHRKNVYLSPHVEKPLNSKVIKSFVAELRSRKCFCISRFLCSTYICYEHSMYVSHIHIWLCYKMTSGEWHLFF